jgi:osmotically-inducible protein OsmY
VTVTVSKGWVTLKGEVDYQFQKIEAEHAARRVTGVIGSCSGLGSDGNSVFISVTMFVS